MGGIKHIYTSPLTSFETTAKEVLGSIRREDGKMFKYVKLAGTDVALGNVLRYADAADYDANTCRVTDGAADDICAGVSLVATTITTAQITAGAFIWVQIRGAVAVSQNVATVGAALTVSIAGAAAGEFAARAAVTEPIDAVGLATGAGTSRVLLFCTT